MRTIPEKSRFRFRIQFLQHRRHGFRKPPPAADRPKLVQTRADQEQHNGLVQLRRPPSAHNWTQFLHAITPSERETIAHVAQWCCSNGASSLKPKQGIPCVSLK